MKLTFESVTFSGVVVETDAEFDEAIGHFIHRLLTAAADTNDIVSRVGMQCAVAGAPPHKEPPVTAPPDRKPSVTHPPQQQARLYGGPNDGDIVKVNGPHYITTHLDKAGRMYEAIYEWHGNPPTMTGHFKGLQHNGNVVVLGTDGNITPQDLTPRQPGISS